MKGQRLVKYAIQCTYQVGLLVLQMYPRRRRVLGRSFPSRRLRQCLLYDLYSGDVMEMINTQTHGFAQSGPCPTHDNGAS